MTKVTMPEAGAYLHQCRKKPTLQALSFRKIEPPLTSKGYESHGLITTAQAEAYADAKVREALEQAAQACESRIRTGDPGIDTTEVDIEAVACAAAVRAPNRQGWEEIMSKRSRQKRQKPGRDYPGPWEE